MVIAAIHALTFTDPSIIYFINLVIDKRMVVGIRQTFAEIPSRHVYIKFWYTAFTR